MKKLFKNVTAKIRGTNISAKHTLKNCKAEGYVDTGVKVLIAVVLGALLLEGLYLLFNDVIDPTAYGQIGSLFSYSG